MNKALASLQSDLAALNLLVNIVCNVDECLFDVLRSLRRSLKEEKTILFSKLLTFLSLYDTAMLKISLITDQHDCGVLARVFAAILQPCCEMVECFTSGDIIHKKCTSSIAIIAPGDGAEFLLTSSIPNLQFDLMTTDSNSTTTKLHTNSQVVNRLEALISELKEKATLTNSSITDDDVLEEVFVLKVDL